MGWDNCMGGYVSLKEGCGVYLEKSGTHLIACLRRLPIMIPTTLAAMGLNGPGTKYKRSGTRVPSRH
jgi:hypothetical protein